MSGSELGEQEGKANTVQAQGWQEFKGPRMVSRAEGWGHSEGPDGIHIMYERI